MERCFLAGRSHSENVKSFCGGLNTDPPPCIPCLWCGLARLTFHIPSVRRPPSLSPRVVCSLVQRCLTHCFPKVLQVPHVSLIFPEAKCPTLHCFFFYLHLCDHHIDSLVGIVRTNCTLREDGGSGGKWQRCGL